MIPSKIQNAKVLIIHCNDQRQGGSSALILSFMLRYPPVSPHFIFDPVTSHRIKFNFDPPYDWYIINKFKHITNIYNKSIIKALCLSKTQKILCSSLAHVHEHKDTFEKLSILHKIYTILVSVSFRKYL